MVANADHTLTYVPTSCTCGQDLSLMSKEVEQKRQVFDLPVPKLEITEHQVLSCTCPNCGQKNTGSFPLEVPTSVQYGSGVRALTVLLYNGMNLSYGKIRQLFADLYGYELNESTQITTQTNCFDKLEGVEQQIREGLLKSAVNNYDETGLRVEGKLHWLHTCSNEKLTYLFVHANRGRKALDSDYSDLTEYMGYAIHDRWRSYFLYQNCQHADCGAHLLRDLQSLIEKGSKWSKQMHDLLLLAYEKSNYGRGICSNLKTVLKKYDLICKRGLKEEPPAVQRFKGKRPKKTKGRNLVEHFIEFKDAVLAFAQKAHIPFTNNLAERDLRPAKVKQKVSGSFRTFDGAQRYARIQAFISTARKQNINVFNELVSIFSNKKCSFEF